MAPTLRRSSVLLPYVVGLAHFAAFNVLYRVGRGSFLGGDSGQFLDIAARLASGALAADADNGKPLGYPLLLVVAGALPGDRVEHAVLLNGGLYLATIWAVGRLARTLGVAPGRARLAQTLFAALPNPVLWANLVLSDTLATALSAGALAVALPLAAAPGARGGPARAVALGGLLGALAITRSEYMLLLPLATALLALIARGPRRPRAAAVALVWVGALPLLAVQPLVTGWHGPRSMLPPRQSGSAQLWGSRYDLEFTQYRFHRLYHLTLDVRRAPGTDPQEIRARVLALRRNYVGGAPIDPALLETAIADVLRVRAQAAAGHAGDDPYGALVVDHVTGHPGQVVRRALTRLVLLATAANLDWPPSAAIHWLHTLLLRPVASVGSTLLVALLVAPGPFPRWALLLAAVWTAFPMLVHSALIFEQRFMYPSVPLLCVVWSLGAEALPAWRRQWTARRRARSGRVNTMH